MATPLPATPVVKPSQARPFFEALEARVKDDPRLPKWSGELYLEYHRGTYTSIGKNKRDNRKMELALRETEIACVYAEKLAGLPYPAQELHDIWEDALTLQFHDILPGSSIKKVYDDSDKMYASMFEKAAPFAIRRSARSPRARRATWRRSIPCRTKHGNVVWFDAPEDVLALRDENGHMHPVQRVEGRAVCYIPDLAPMTETPLWYSKDAVEGLSQVTADEKNFDTPYFSGAFDGAMRIVSLTEKATGRQVVKEGQALTASCATKTSRTTTTRGTSTSITAAVTGTWTS
jgi:alpha-mannosidase